MTMHRYSLIEMIMYVAVVFLVVSVAGHFFYHASLLQRGYSRDAFVAQRFYYVQREWQRLVHQTEPADWQADAAGFQAGRLRAFQEGDKLNLVLPGRQLAVRLPANAEARFHIEAPPGQPKIAVLDLAWDRQLFRKRHRETLRLVAGARGVE